jgi:hypothetical protein
MSKSRKQKRNNNPPITPVARRRIPAIAAVLLALVVCAAGAFWWSKPRHAQPPPEPPVNPTVQPASSSTANPAYERLKGKWLRPDGGYILEIRSVEPGGQIDAGYFNPNPIHVAKALALQEGAVTKLFIELRDVNYPGSTYTLAYEAGSDRLAGIYFQATMQQQFDVVFERAK